MCRQIVYRVILYKYTKQTEEIVDILQKEVSKCIFVELLKYQN
jgi:hypothetical protein